MDDIGKNISNIDEDEQNSSSVVDEMEVENLKYNWFLMVN